MSLQLPAILSPPTLCIPSPALTVSPLEEVAEVALPLYGSASGSGLRSPYASSPLHQAVSCSSLLYLWTGSSSPVASHPAFRRRSFLRLRTASVLSDGDFHPTVGAHSQAHVGTRSCAIRRRRKFGDSMRLCQILINLRCYGSADRAQRGLDSPVPLTTAQDVNRLSLSID